MQTEEIEVNKIKITNNYVNYDNNKIIIKTNWLPAYYNKKFQILNVQLTKDDKLYEILSKVDSLVSDILPEDDKQSTILKHYNDKVSISLKLNYTQIFDDNKKQIKNLNVLENSKFEVRLILLIAPIKEYKGFFGSKCKCQQMQIKKLENEYEEYMFD
jgi:hypothetical protein